MEIDSSNSQPTSLVDKIVIPGNVVLDLSKMTNQTIKLGAGLRQECDTLSAMKAGKLRFVKPNKYWVESSNKRYIFLVLWLTANQMLLSSPTCPLLEALGKKLSFEIAVGLNGRVWVNASSPSTVILVSNAITSSEFLSGMRQRIMVEKLLQRMEQ